MKNDENDQFGPHADLETCMRKTIDDEMKCCSLD